MESMGVNLYSLPPYLIVVFCYVSFVCLYALIYPRYDVIKEESDAFVDDYRRTSLAWLTSIFGTLAALTLGSRSSIYWDLVIFSFFLLPALVHVKRYYPFTIRCKYISIDPQSGAQKFSESNTNTARPEPNGTYCLTLNMNTGSQINQYVLDIDAPPEVKTENVESPESNHSVRSDGNIWGFPPDHDIDYDIHLYLKPTSKLSAKGPNPVTIRYYDTDRKLETVELLP